MDMGFSDSRAFDPGDAALALRPLGWSELCARLVAAQDLRRHQAGRIGQGAAGASAPAGSFHGAAARMLEQHDPVEGFVNPTSSVYGKDNQGKTVISSESPLIERDPRQSDENCHD
jgi:hypothetical protein